MADRTPTQQVTITERATFQFKRNAVTDFANFKELVSETISITPEGGDPKEFKAISGNTITVGGKVEFYSFTVKMFISTNDLEILRMAYGEPDTQGTGPFTHEFAGNGVPVNGDFVLTLPDEFTPTEGTVIEGTNATITPTSIDMEFDEAGMYEFQVKVPAQNYKTTVTTTLDIATTP